MYSSKKCVSCVSMCFFCASHGWTLFDPGPDDASWIWDYCNPPAISSFTNSWLWALGQTNWNPQILSTEFNCSSLCNGSSVGGMARLRLWLCLSVLLPSSSDFSPSSFTLPNDSRRPSWFAFLDYCMHNLSSSGCHRAQNGSKASKRAISNCFKLARQFVLNGYI